MQDIFKYYQKIYQGISDEHAEFDDFLKDLQTIKQQHFNDTTQRSSDWYKDAVVYSLYVEDYRRNLSGLAERLDDFVTLGVDCLWLLPILESPMKDAGFDISDYRKVRQSLLGETTFEGFIEAAHQKNIKVIFDIAMNHCSDQHPWFLAAKDSLHSPLRDFFIWRDDDQGYPEARIIFKGMCDSNWTYQAGSGQYFFHRFFDIQPDLNYRNPAVLLAMTRILIDWKIKGVDGFRADAIPFIWKEDGTNCENLPKAHTIIKFIRAVLDYLQPGTLLLAEACQPPVDVVNYFGTGDECHGAYHFPLMPRIYLSMATAMREHIIRVIDPVFTPDIPDNCQWFTFLRCHDELTLEMVDSDERHTINDYYLKDSLWNFREGEGISARLADLLDHDPARITMAFSIMLTLMGTPILYYGDEYGKSNDVAYYQAYRQQTGYADSRYLVRGPIDWPAVEHALNDPQSLSARIYHKLKKLIATRKQYSAFARGQTDVIAMTGDDNSINSHILAYIRQDKQTRILIIHNLSDQIQSARHPLVRMIIFELLDNPPAISDDKLTLAPFAVHWFKI